jgi:hypothetical protein
MPAMLRSLLLTLALLATLPFTANHAQAAGTPLSVTDDIYLLVAETTMIMIEMDPAKHASLAREIMQRLKSAVPAAIATVAGNDAALAAELNMQWADLQSAYQGESFGIAFRENSYDTNLTAHYTSGSGALLMAFSDAATAEAAKSTVQKTRLRVLQTVVSYLQVSTGIVGGTSFSANDTDSDIPAGVAAVDKGLAELKAKFSGKPHADTLKTASSRWAFLRPALLNPSNQAAPYAVYTHGLGVASLLEQLETP